MDNKVVNISFNIWASNEEEGAELKRLICEFIDWHGSRGHKVTAKKLSVALSKWQDNLFVRNSIIKHFS